ncbi:DUF1990 family protein [Actinomadura algeriensis]|uniref:Uncharacterized protein (UPF0548 family) n=1 Tax=Actinomadura algeriensis TaxID=1679523 RepID=A0ABR9JX04_9ACTN|nr:DUF1990 domain-containing protein [Actinomadura algeriensis]MBE1534914.1 uncharacterized protein (UPF0548 family) [Actinomadura algeriensis]
MTADALTYPEVGATRAGVRPEGYRHLRVRTRVGEGPDALRDAADAVIGLRMHRALPARVRASAPRAEPGADVEVAVGVGPLRLRAPCRVVWTSEDGRGAGFGYGTLPGHAMSGEESFVVDIDDAGAVWLTITSFSRPATTAARLAGPLAPLFQRLYARTCGIALRRLIGR